MNWILIIAAVILAGLLLSRMQAGGLAAPEKVAGLRQQAALILDVRSPAEYRANHLPGTLNIPLAELAEQIGRAAPDKRQPLLLHCASGARSAAGKKTLEQLGYTNVHNLGSLARAEKLLRAPAAP